MAILPYINYDPAAEQQKIAGNNQIKDLLIKAGEAYASGGATAIGGPMNAETKAKTARMKSASDAQDMQLHDEAMKYLHTTLLNPQSPGYNPTLAPGYAHAHGIDLQQDMPQEQNYGNGLMTPQGM